MTRTATKWTFTLLTSHMSAFATEQALVAEHTNGFSDVYLYDRLTATSRLLSSPLGGIAAREVAADDCIARGRSIATGRCTDALA